MGTRARSTPSTDEQVSVLDDRLHFKPSHSQCGADLALVVLVQLHIGVASLVLDGEPVLLLPEVCSLRSPLTPTSARQPSSASNRPSKPTPASGSPARDRSLCLRASEAEAQAAGRLDAADVNGNGAPI